MIRVSNQKLKIKYDPGYSPKIRFVAPSFSIPDWGFLGVESYMEYIYMESPHISIEEFLHLSQQNSQIHQFNVLAPDLKSLQRQIIVWRGDSPNLFAWTWVECYIKYPIYKKIIKVLNKILGLKRFFVKQ